MNIRLIAVAGTAVVAATATVVAAGPSLAANKTHTLTFVAVSTFGHQLDKTHFVAADKDKSGGEVIGTDSLTCVVRTRTTARCHVAAAFKGGILLGAFTQNSDTGDLSGKVIGGTGKFDGATGTISGTAQSQNREKVTLTYHT
jgi:hypothetical protein